MRTNAPVRRRALLTGLVALLAAAFAGAAELAVRLTALAVPSLRSMPLRAEHAGLMRPDEELFWALRPNLSVFDRGARVTTNRLGLRAPEIGPKQPREIRILSLGASVSFGPGVESDETYAGQLERILRERLEGRSVTVVNAGVPAYSSFQSLTYLRRYGLALEPDIVLFYHERNDYLPASLRDSSSTEADVIRSDRQLYHSKKGAVWRRMVQHSALVRAISYAIARYRIRQYQARGTEVAAHEIGLPGVGTTPRLRWHSGDDESLTEIEERRLPTRVLAEERRGILEELLALCRANGIELVIIHPSYRASTPHECVTTQFCAERGVPMLEAYDVLHPPAIARGLAFRDGLHLNPRGHRALALAIARFLEERRLLPADGAPASATAG